MRSAMLMTVTAVITACATGGPGEPSYSPSAGVDNAGATITARDMYRRISILADDSMAGRDTPSPGLESAARYVAAEFRDFGLEPAGEGGWMQRYPYRLEGLDVANTRLEIVASPAERLELGSDFAAYPGTTPAREVGAVWLGDAIGSSDGDAIGSSDGDAIGSGGDVAADDLRDRAVILRFQGRPTEYNGVVGFHPAIRSRMEALVDQAGAVGAAAVIFVLEEGVGAVEIAAFAEAAAVPSRLLGGWQTRTAPAAFLITRDAARRLFRAGGLDAAGELSRPRIDEPMPLSGVRLRLAAPYHARDDEQPPNVIGLLRGSDPNLRDTYVVVSAHVDHIGIGPPDATGDSIYNGAADNASGVAALLGVAQAFADLGIRPLRSVLFLAVSGEERNLLGARWFVEHPTVPLESIVANINIDVIGVRGSSNVSVVGQKFSSLGPVIREVAGRNTGLGLTVVDERWSEPYRFFRSDHFAFVRQEIPALWFYDGPYTDHYHRPSDEVDIVDADKAARIARLVFHLTHELAQMRTAPTWTEEGLAAVRRMASADDREGRWQKPDAVHDPFRRN